MAAPNAYIMGSRLSKTDRVRPSELNILQNHTYDRQESLSSDQFKTDRTTTDVFFLLLFTLFLTVFLCLFGYCVFNGNIFRVINGYDKCGYICGKMNIFHQQKEDLCSDTDLRLKKYHLVIMNNDTNVKERLCVTNCSAFQDYRVFFNRCIPKRNNKIVNTFLSKSGLKDFFQEISEDFQLCWREFIYLCLISLGFSLIILLLFRFVVGFVVWMVLIGVTLACLAGSAFLWILWNQSKNIYNDKTTSEIDMRKVSSYFVFAILSTVATVIVILVIIVMRKRIQLVVQLFKESGKAITSMPILLMQPVLTFTCLISVILLWSYFVLWIESSGRLTKDESNTYYYKKDTWMKVTRWYNLFALFWMIQFLISCQHMVIAGAVSTWYFMRDKSKLNSPVLESEYNLIRYHLGSVALGSMLIALVQFLRVILKALEKYLKKKEGSCIQFTLRCCQCCLYCFEKFLKYLSRNAYIQIAIYGYSFCKSRQQAFRLLTNNVLRVAAINSVGDFILFLGKVLVVMATVLIGIEMLKKKEGLQHMWVPIALAAIFAYFVSHCFMTVYEMTIDTIFLCFCEDCEQNDGITRPYYMSKGLMEFVENSKRKLNVKDSPQFNATAWRPQQVSSIS